MAVINQSPAGQSSVTLSGIVLDSIDASGTPFWQSRKIVGSASVQIQLGGANLFTPAALLGKNASVSTSDANGIWTLQDQLAAKRASVWPSPPA